MIKTIRNFFRPSMTHIYSNNTINRPIYNFLLKTKMFLMSTDPIVVTCMISGRKKLRVNCSWHATSERTGWVSQDISHLMTTYCGMANEIETAVFYNE